MLDAVAIITLALWALLDERRPKGQKLTSPFRMLQSTVVKKKLGKFQRDPARMTPR